MDRSLCIIGGGASGLIAGVTAKHLYPSLRIKIYEQSGVVGGLWRYNKQSLSNPAIYRDLHSNLPTRLMEVPFYPFEIPEKQAFPHHSTVLDYIEGLGREYGIGQHIQINTRVKKVETVKTHLKHNGFSVKTVDPSSSSLLSASSEEFDYLLCCSGSFSKPRIPPELLEEVEKFGASYSHSQSFDKVEDFDQYDTVIVFGCGSSGRDIVSMLSEHRAARRVETNTGVTWMPSSKVKRRYNQYNLVEERNGQESIIGRIVLGETLDGILTKIDSQSTHVIFATGYHRPAHPYLPTELQPPDLLKRDLFDSRSGFSTVLGNAGFWTSNIGFLGYLPVTSPLGMTYWQSKFFLDSIVGRKRYEKKNLSSERAWDFFDPIELSYRDLLHSACLVEDIAELKRRQRMFEVCENEILRNFLTYRGWNYDFDAADEVRKWKVGEACGETSDSEENSPTGPEHNYKRPLV